MAKKLLNEAVVRRFQSLANISPINEMSSYKRDDEEEKIEETIEEGEENLEEGMYEDDEDPADAEAPELDAPEAPELDAPEAALEDVELTDEEAEALIALGEKLAAAMGDAGEEPEEIEMGDAPEAPEMGGEEEMPMEEALEGINYVPSQTEIVNEVARRVARRLAEAQKAEKKMNEALGRK